MRYFAALVLLMSLAAVRATDDHSPSPTTKPTTPSPPTTPTKPGTPTGGGKGDPIMTGLDGRSFEFFGKAGSSYSVLSEKNHQLTMKLKEGKMWDHEGSYMSALGFTYGEHTVEVSNTGDSLTVALDGEVMAMRPSQTEQEVILGLAQGEMQLLWQLHRPDFGNAVEITTDLLQLVAWVTPAGTRDEGGKLQPAYLNFDLTLLSTPAHNSLEGILGTTYAAATGTAVSAANDDFKFHGDEAAYEVASLFETAHPTSLFGKAGSTKGRKLIEAAFPMRASTRGFAAVLRASSQGILPTRKALN